MKAIYITALILLAFLFVQPPLYAADCPDYKFFFKEINPAKRSWKNLYEIYKESPSYCDDGAYGAGYSDFVVQSLAKYWNRFDELLSFTRKDPSFQSFVLKHIDATTDLGDLETLSKNVRKNCPASEVPFCKEIDKKARAAIEDIKTYEKKE
jgi:hypothetical protein